MLLYRKGLTCLCFTRRCTCPVFKTRSNSKLPFSLTGENVSKLTWPLRKAGEGCIGRKIVDCWTVPSGNWIEGAFICASEIGGPELDIFWSIVIADFLSRDKIEIMKSHGSLVWRPHALAASWSEKVSMMRIVIQNCMTASEQSLRTGPYEIQEGHLRT